MVQLPTFIFLLIAFISSENIALAFDYFNREIDYWNKREALKTKPNQHKAEKKRSEKEKFNWSKYKDPKNDEFFEEGDYKPPKPFMEVARNPSDENIKNWFAIIEAKNTLMNRLQTKLAEYISQNHNKLTVEEKEEIQNEINKLQGTRNDPYRFRFRLYFDSSCPHCKNMVKTMKEIQDQGYFVELRQIDEKKPNFPVPFPVSIATKDELTDKKISAWPVLFIADSKTKQIYRLDGYQTAEKIYQSLAKKG